MQKKFFIKILCFIIVANLFFVVPVPQASAQTVAYVPSGHTISGGAYTDNQKAYNYSIVTYLKLMPSNTIIDITYPRGGRINITDVDDGNYQLEIYFQNDLLNPGINIVPLYTQNVSVDGEDVVLDRITMPAPTKCPKGETFSFDNGTGTCAVIAFRQPMIYTNRLEDQIFALVNFYRKRSRLKPFERNYNLQSFFREHVMDMSENNYFKMVDSEGCDDTCRYNNSYGLDSQPYGQLAMYYNYDKVFVGGAPARYVTEYNLARKIARRVRYGAVRDFDYFEIAIEMRNNKLYMQFGGMAEYTDAENAEMRNILDGLVSSYDSDREKIDAVHNWITTNIAYDTRLRNISHYGVGAFRNRMAVCSGYADLFRHMLAMVGVDAPIVTGRAPRPHAWNMVTLGGEEFYVDETWSAGYVSRRKFTFNQTDTYYIIPQECIMIDHYTDIRQRVLNRQAYIRANYAFFEENCPGLITKYL